MKYEDIKYFSQRCEEHPDHQSGMISNSMIQQRLHEEIDELREYIEQLQGEEHMNAFDYKGQPSVWTRDAELKMINNGKILGLKRREQIREKEIQGHHPLQAKKNKK